MRDTTPSTDYLRRRLLRAIASGAVAGGFSSVLSSALAKGDLPAIPGINQLEGKVLVNGNTAKVGSVVKPGDRVVTGEKSQAVILLNKDAFLVREQSDVEFAAEAGVFARLKIAAGKVLSVWGRGPQRAIVTRNATIGIRGTGAYFEVHGPNRTYFCLCYGEAGIEGQGLSAPKIVRTKHHESPLWLDDSSGSLVSQPGPFLNHTDAELDMLEALCGRESAFKEVPAHLRY